MPQTLNCKVICSIQCLRAAAALAVVVAHAVDGAAANSGNRHFGEFATIGSAGVDVFFVISGFIMYVTACSRSTTPGQFLVDRFSRIVPLYWVATFLLMAVVVIGKAPLPDIRYLLASLALVPVNPLPYLGVGWTLVYEMFFYVLLAVALIWRPRHLWIITVVMLALVLAGATSRPDWVVARVYTGPLLLEFLAGIWLGVAWSRGVWMIPPVVGAGLLVVATAGLAGGYASGLDSGMYSSVLARGVPAVLIVAGMLSFELLPCVRNRTGLLLGAASYAIYLSHLTVTVFVRMAFAKAHVIEPWTILVVSLAAAISAGIAFHLTVERPLVAITRLALHRLGAGLRCRFAKKLPVMIKPSAGPRVNASIPRSRAPGSPRSIGGNSAPTNDATAWMAPSCPVPALNSKLVKPV
jgi:exopolysaccharide production protein ExoZ